MTGDLVYLVLRNVHTLFYSKCNICKRPVACSFIHTKDLKKEGREDILFRQSRPRGELQRSMLIIALFTASALHKL